MCLISALLTLLSCKPCPTGQTCQAPCPDCPPAVTSPDYATWLASIPEPSTETSAAKLDLFQYDEGELNIKGDAGGPSAVDLGAVWSFHPPQRKEGFVMEKLRAYSTSTNQIITEVNQKTQGDEAAFRLLADESPPGTKVKCTDQMDACVALDDYDYVSLPDADDFPNINPAGTLSTVVSVMNRKYDGCDETTHTDTQGAWLYRTRAVIDGQVKWVELWFMSSSRNAPSICKTDDPPNTPEFDETHSAASTDPPSPRAFVDQLNGVGCTPAPGNWCGYCSSNACTYTKVELDWWKKR